MDIFVMKIVFCVAVAVLLTGQCSGEGSCLAEERDCLDGTCVYLASWCDGEVDCSNGKDEENCGERDCARTEFQCDNKKCVQQILFCDGVDNCGDNSDERDCDTGTLKKCPKDDQFLCDNHKQCIDKTKLCDMHVDCVDESDETEHVCAKRDCMSSQFACTSGHQCIPARYKCDGQEDCADGSDELCDEDSVSCNVTTGQFQCADMTCISLDKLCDGKIHCLGHEDEGGQCETACRDSACDHKCQASPKGPVCQCFSGYQMLADQKTCEDIDECNNYNTRVCSQICINSPSSYHCECKDGYRLTADKHTCKVTDSGVTMLFSDVHNILSVNLSNHAVKSIVSNKRDITDIAYDQAGSLGTVFWTDKTDTAVYSTHIDDPLNEHMIPVILEGLISPQGITVDWVSGLLYITDSIKRIIIACDMQGIICSLLVSLEYGHVPTAIVVDPARGQMYWSSLGHSPYIAKGTMDGLQHNKIITKHLTKPTGLFLDDTTESLYWADHDLGCIGSIGYDGTKLQHIEVNGNPFSVAVFEDRLYWSDPKAGHIFSINKFKRQYLQSVVERTNPPKTLHPIHPALYKKTSNPCLLLQECSHLCLLSNFGGELSHTCGCPVGYHLDQDKISCQESMTNPLLLVNTATDVIKLDLFHIGKKMDKVFRIPLASANSVDFDPIRKMAVYSDSLPGVIGAVDIFSTDVRPRGEVILNNLNSSVADLAVDWMGQNIFWLNLVKKSLEVCKLDGSFCITLKKDLEGTPTTLLTHPQSGLLVYATKGDNSAIMACEMTGENCNPIVSDVGDCQGLAMGDDGRLYWADLLKGHIGSTSLDGRDHMILIDDLNPISLVVYKDIIYWISSQSDKVQRFSLADHKLMRQLIPVHESMKDLSLVDWSQYSPDLSNGCSDDNGGCSHFCLAKKYGKRKCACPEEFTLAEDGNRCSIASMPPCRSDEIHCDSVKCVSSAVRCDGLNDCQDGTDEENCTHIKVPPHVTMAPSISKSTSVPISKGSPTIEPLTEAPLTCEPDEFPCKRHGLMECIPNKWKCDQHPDCDSKVDEQDCPEATTPPILVTTRPKQTTRQPIQSCSEMGQYSCSDGSCLDQVKVCDKVEDCAHGEDEYKCDPYPDMLIGHQNTISRLKDQGMHPVLSGLTGDVVSVDIDQETGNIYWVNSLGSVKKWVKNLNKIISPVRSFLQATHIAFDWVTGNVYILDDKNVVVCSKDITLCKVLLDLEMNPKGIALSPEDGLMFWTRDGADCLMKCWMNGEQCEVILNSYITKAHAITIDNGQVYIADESKGSIERLDFMGQNRYSFRHVGDPRSLDISAHWLYFSDKEEKVIMRHSIDSRPRSEVVYEMAASGLRVIDPAKQPISQNRCEHMVCGHLCLLKPSSSECACATGYSFTDSSTACQSCSTYCQNGGSCTIEQDKLTCDCPDGVSGTRCENVLSLDPMETLKQPLGKVLPIPAPTSSVLLYTAISKEDHSKNGIITKPKEKTSPTIAVTKPISKENQKNKIINEVIKDDLVPVINSQLEMVNSTKNFTRKTGGSQEEGNGAVVGVVVTILIILTIVTIVLLVIWKKGKKPKLSKLVWYHKGSNGHKKIEETEELVHGGEILNPGFQEQDINFNVEKGEILRYPSDTSIDSAFISAQMSQLNDTTGSTCRLVPSESV